MNKELFSDLNRRDFLRGGSAAAVMALMGGVPILAEDDKKPANSALNADGSTNYKGEATPINVGVIGCGLWGREVLKTLSRIPYGPVVAICDTYPAYLKRAADIAPKAEKYSDYTKLLEDKNVQVVIVATPTHQHKDIVIAAMKAGKHVYCEAPLASNIEDAKAIALAAKESLKVNFQVGLQNRCDKQYVNLAGFLRTGVIGKWVKARTQFHKKQSWRLTSPNPDREKEINWRLDKSVSLGLTGELGIHQLDIASWYQGALPLSVTGFGSIVNWKDGRDVADSVEVVFEYPDGAIVTFEGALTTSFESEMNLFFGTNSTIMQRERRAWMFKEADAPLLGWEVYARKDAFYKESGVVLGAGATKQTTHSAKGTDADVVDATSTMEYALGHFLVNSFKHGAAVEDYLASYDANDKAAFKEYLAGLEKSRLAAPGWKEGYETAVVMIKANEAILKGQKLTFDKASFEI